MAITPRDRIKEWFETGDYPTQAQFWAWIDSFIHKSDVINANDIAGLNELLISKAEKEVFNDHVANKSNPHSVTKAQLGLANVENLSLTAAINALKANVPAAGNTLKKLYDLITAIQTLKDNNIPLSANYNSIGVDENNKQSDFNASVESIVQSLQTSMDSLIGHNRREELTATNIDLRGAAILYKTITANTTFTASNYVLNKTTTLELIVNASLTVTFPDTFKRISGGINMDGSTVNYVQLLCVKNDAANEKVMMTINQELP